MLEYHLDTLTSRSQETEFEGFARALLKLEICPNILPQTGPTGGGDSKVDSETYPVADSLALAWYVGVGRESESERWAFAFSAKKKWGGKLRSDVAKLAATGRGYKKAFFVTNQFVRDKRRGELEDELSEAHKLDVRILDRTWILDVVFDHGRQEVAIKELGVSPTIRKKVRLGPLDLRRESELVVIEQRISESASSQDVGFVTVDDCIDAAILSRELERPQAETQGRFDRADKLAMSHGTDHQRVRSAYGRAWTAFFWFEDIPKFVELYSVVEERTEGTRNIYDLELHTNLWMLLHGHAQDLCDFERHSQVLKERLGDIADNEETPTAALEAQAFIKKMELTRAVAAQESCDTQLQELSDIIKESESLAGFPLLPLADTLIALGDVLGAIPEYDSLHSQLVEVVTRRKGEVEGAKLLLRRAEQQLGSERPTDAINSIGKALHRLAKDESREQFGRALCVCACAYERIGLLWAARGTLLLAASLSMSDFWKYDDVTPFQAICLRRLKWIELQLGRIPHVLSWHEADATIHSVLVAQGYDEDCLSNGHMEFEAILGILLLKVDFWELKDVVRLPDQLSSMGLNLASVALLYALGHDSEFKNELTFEDEDRDDQSFFLRWRDQPASDDLPKLANLCDRATAHFESNVLGCLIDVTSPNEQPFVELAESFLAAIEATLSTGMIRRLAAREPKFTATIKESDFCSEPFEFSVDDESGYPLLSISCRSFDPDKLSVDEQRNLKARMAEMVAYSIGYIIVPDLEGLEQLFRDDLAIRRAIDFTGSFQVIGNVLGENRKRYMSSWIDENNVMYPVKRDKAWDAESPRIETRVKHVKSASTGASGPEERDFSRHFQTSRHTQFRTLSLIRESLWNKADWQGLGVVAFPDSPPILALIFGKRDAAKRIFELWEEQLGKVDESEALRITVIRHVDTNNPHHYRVVVGSNIESENIGKAGAIFSLSRIHTMTPNSSQNLESFLKAYRDFGAYFVAPAIVDDSGQYPESIGDFSILKRELIVKEAWEVGRNDFDSVGILADDKPAIPTDVGNPPVHDLLKWKRSNERGAKKAAHRGQSDSSGLTGEKRKKAKTKRPPKRKSRKRK
ncbi:hypothetical protein [Rosistilla oblonga]|uniref:hypothetical protein n=1 Tax=Rosistilla oblonga TaxID=2527990 RepID=UPI003A976E64